MPNAILYRRVSTDEQELSLDAQLAACEAAAARLGLSLASSFTDEGLCGALPAEDRPGLLAALGALRKGDVLLVAKRDRLGRDHGHVAMIEAAVRRKGARVISAAGEGTEHDDPDDPASMMMRGMVDLFAEYERLIIKARTKTALAAKARRKERTGALRYGYDLAADGPRSKKNGLVTALVPNAKEQLVISHMQKWRDAGKSLRAIARRLNEGKVPSKTGKAWTHVTVKAALDYAELVA